MYLDWMFIAFSGLVYVCACVRACVCVCMFVCACVCVHLNGFQISSLFCSNFASWGIANV